MLTTDTHTLSLDCAEYGETQAAAWVLGCSADDLLRICDIANFLTTWGPRTPRGRPVILAQACAMAVVHVCEGVPRQLARTRRKVSAELPLPVIGNPRTPDLAALERAGECAFVDDEVIDFWAHDPDAARTHREKCRREHTDDVAHGRLYLHDTLGG